MKKFVQCPISVRSSEDKGNSWEDKSNSRENKGNSRENKGNSRVASNGTMSRAKREVVRNPCLTFREDVRPVVREDVSKTTRCRLLKQVANNVKPVTRSP